MTNCKYCGARVHEQDDFCVACGRKVDNDIVETEKRESLFLYRLVSLVLPFLGFIIFLLNRKTHRIRARSCLKWSLFGTFIYVAILVLLILFYLAIIIGILTP